jgi:perosamine synthetase
MERIPFNSPSIGDREVSYVADSVPHCASELADDYRLRFEQAFADHLQVRHAIAVSSRSAAIHVALAALEIGVGQEVIVPELLPSSSVLPLKYLGATPVFADVDPQSWCLSAESFRQSITPRTKAVLAVDLYGQLPEIHRIRAIARARGIAVLEDATDAFGSEFLNRHAGTLGDVGVFGFTRSETLTSGEGGRIVTDCDRLARSIRNSLEQAGFDYHLTPMQAALGAAQLERSNDLIAQKRAIAHWYRQALNSIPGIYFAETAAHSQTTNSEVTVLIESAEERYGSAICRELAMVGIECRPAHQPASSLEAWAESPQARVARSRNHVSYQIGPRAVSLPSGTNLSRSQVERVAANLCRIIGQLSSSAPPTRLAA